MKTLFGRLFRRAGPTPELPAADQARNFLAGLTVCENCRANIPIARYAPLALSPCPNCKALFFVPGRLDRWILCRPVGTGAFGKVYLGLCSDDLRLQAAVKILTHDDQASEEAVEDFLREAETGSRFGAHPNLMAVYAYGRLDNGAFAVTELIAGKSLSDLVALNPAGISAEECIYYALDVVAALERILACGYLYRDLNMENVRVRENGSAVLIDYGLCKPLDQAMAHADGGKILGTPLFVPPERCLQQPEDARSDIYSFGMVFFYTLTGRPFFAGQELTRVIKGHLGALRLPTAAKMPNFDPRLVAIVDRAIKLDLRERYQGYEELRTDLYAVLARLTSQPPASAVAAARRPHFKQFVSPV